MELFYLYEFRSELIGYVNVGFLFNPHKIRSQIGYLFIYGGTTIAWHLTKTNYNRYFFKSYKNNSNLWGKLRICLAKIDD